MKTPKRIHVVPQRKDWDCGIAALASLLDCPYGDVAAAARAVIDPKKFRKYGLNIQELQGVSRELGHLLFRRHPLGANRHVAGATGILGVLSPKMHSAGHWVVLKDGITVIDPDGGDVWLLTDYLKHWKARACTLLVLRA